MTHATFLGPVGATFSHDAFTSLARIYRLPNNLKYVPADTNGEVLSRVAQHGGYGAIAMDTHVSGRVTETLESFIKLLNEYDSQTCPVSVIGASRLTIHFCRMAKTGVHPSDISTVVAHPKGLNACRERIDHDNLEALEVSSNGEAARLIAEDDAYKSCAALGPASAAKTYDLEILDSAYEDAEAITTFFLLRGTRALSTVGNQNRALVIFQLKDEPGALVKALLPFDAENLNLRQIHSSYAGNETYNFAIEVEVPYSKRIAFDHAVNQFTDGAHRYLCFGPFEVS